MYIPKKYFPKQEVPQKEESTDIGAKLDITILHIADCILEMDKRNDADRIPALASALAELVTARTEADKRDIWE
ncbi:MAG: hypothetical protein NC432_08655 [Roseburia sp.]|nr:hypothetical protein [Roseburia sp.]MCM1097817.1 hypothetical protein [Ruminococcus flavefaciens]